MHLYTRDYKSFKLVVWVWYGGIAGWRLVTFCKANNAFKTLPKQTFWKGTNFILNPKSKISLVNVLKLQVRM